jgi:hypothetical protein
MDIMARDDETITVTATAIGDSKSVQANPVTVSVRKPDLGPEPKILSFKATKDRVKLGEAVLFTFTYSDDVVKLVLSPTNQQILPPQKQIQIVPTTAGAVEYELFAYTKNNRSTSKKVTVDAEQVSAAKIIDFSADPSLIQAPDGKTTVKWNVTNAVQVMLDAGDGLGAKEVPFTSSMDVLVDRNVTLKLTAIDSNGIATSKKLSIRYKPLPPATTTGTGTSPPPPTTTTTGGTTGGNR